MKIKCLLLLLIILLTATSGAFSQQTNKTNVFDKVNNSVTKVSNIIAVFQPYLLKARQLYYDGKQLAGDVKYAAKNMQGAGNGGYNSGTAGGQGTFSTSTNNTTPTGTGFSNDAGSNSQANNTGFTNLPAQNTTGNTQQNNGQNTNTGGFANNAANGNPQNYLQGQSLPINNPATINNDGTGNLGNQNNGLYGNCLDAMTGNVLGMGEAAQSPTSVDLMFFAPADGQNTYYLMTPGFAKNNSTAGYMTEHASEQVLQWTDVNESEVALTRLTIGQFNQIQNNNQIQNAVRNAQNYAAYYASVGQKLDGQVFAVKMQLDNREVYALIAVVKQMGTSGSNGYLKIKIKSVGIDTNHDGQADANAYVR